MSQKKHLQELLVEATNNRELSAKQNKSKEWLRDKAKTHSKENTLRRQARRNNLLGDDARASATIEIGMMYLLTYDAKHKKTLPYWDFHPIIFPIESGTGYIIGLNLHYLPPKLRAMLLDAILDLPTYPSEKQRAKMSYNIIRSFSASDLAKPTIHKYLTSHLVSMPIAITRDEWDYVSMLPLADFRSMTGSASISKVYADSKRKM